MHIALRARAAVAALVAALLALGWQFATRHDADPVAPGAHHVEPNREAAARSAPSFAAPMAPATAAEATASSAPRRASSAPEPRLVERPLREATDTGRAQPVFLSLLGVRQVRVGQRMEVELAAESENDYAGASVIVAFDAERLRVVAVRPAGSSIASATPAALTSSVDAVGGRITLEISSPKGATFPTGGSTLAVIEFAAVQRGTGSISIAQAAAHDSNDEGVAASPVGPYSFAVSD